LMVSEGRRRFSANSMKRSRQLVLAFRQRGGARKGAGRKPNGSRPMVSRSRRDRIIEGTPAHVTLKIRAGVLDLRRVPAFRVVKRAIISGAAKRSFQIVEYSVQHDHIHMIVEAEDNGDFSRGVQGLCVRIARAINRFRGKTGKVFRDRFHSRVLKSPRETKWALKYVLLNGAKHLLQEGRRVARGWLDPLSSAPSFSGWTTTRAAGPPRELPAARCWLLRLGWRFDGALDPADIPAR
jgi:REP element-mobilizing transposase RayT